MKHKLTTSQIFIYIVSPLLMICVALIIVFLFTMQPLVIKSPYAGYEAGYDAVVLDPKYFCSTQMKSTKDVTITSELTCTPDEYIYDQDTLQVVSVNRDYLYEGRYNLVVGKYGDKQQVLLSVYDTQPPVFDTAPNPLVIEEGTKSEMLYQYFEIHDYDDLLYLDLFAEDIDLNKPRKTKATAVASDSHGNYSDFALDLTIVSHKDAKAKPDQLSKVAQNPVKLSRSVGFRRTEYLQGYLDELNAKREANLKAEENLAKELGAEIPDFTKDRTGETTAVVEKSADSVTDNKNDKGKDKKDEEKKDNDKDHTDNKDEDKDKNKKANEDKKESNKQNDNKTSSNTNENSNSTFKPEIELLYTNLDFWENLGFFNGYDCVFLNAMDNVKFSNGYCVKTDIGKPVHTVSYKINGIECDKTWTYTEHSAQPINIVSQGITLTTSKDMTNTQISTKVKLTGTDMFGQYFNTSSVNEIPVNIVIEDDGSVKAEVVNTQAVTFVSNLYKDENGYGYSNSVSISGPLTVN